ncbi:MAG: xanthine dehydrogenase family protein subunit M [Synechococcales bacterium]|nr:xanthine dehydrogenase family protein subunit M [Synechococcales bacterium]
MKNFTYHRAKIMQEVVKRPADAMVIAGGTNLVDRMKAFLDQPSQLVDISHLALKGIDRTRQGWKIGALVTNTELADHPDIRRAYPLLSRAILSGASQQIRNVATVGGNLMQRTRCPYYYNPDTPCNKRQPGTGCPATTGSNRMHAILGASHHCVAVHPSDMCVALAALGAIVHLESAKGKRQVIFNDFHRLPGEQPDRDTILAAGEVITAITIPRLPFAQSGVYLKLRDRASYSFALISVAAILEVQDQRIRNARLALGGVAHKPWRSLAVEQFLVGKPVEETIFHQAADQMLQAANPLGENGFKVEMSKRAIRRALMLSAKGGGIA